jgi:hypothetical protein
MSKSIVLLALLCLLSSFGSGDLLRTRVKDAYTKEIGVREATNKNDGPRVETYLRSTGLGKGYSWCAAFVHFIFNECGVKNAITAWSPTAYNPKNIVYEKGVLHKEPLAADVFQIYSVSMKRVCHTGFVNRRLNSRMVETVEGNTNPAGSREGGGVYKLIRSIKSLHRISRFIPD